MQDFYFNLNPKVHLQQLVIYGTRLRPQDRALNATQSGEPGAGRIPRWSPSSLLFSHRSILSILGPDFKLFLYPDVGQWNFGRAEEPHTSTRTKTRACFG